MKHLSLVLFLLSGMILAAPCLAAEHVFGLDWQSTPAQLEAKGIQLKLRKTDNRLSMYETSKLPKNLSDAESYLLIFDKNAGLVKVIMVTRSFTDDAAGAHGKQRFDQLDSLLHQRGYKSIKGQQVEKAGKAAAKGFYTCLASPGCGTWKAAYRKNHVLVSMQLRGMPQGTGFIVMNFQEEPQFTQALKKNRKPSTMQKDAQAF